MEEYDEENLIEELARLEQEIKYSEKFITDKLKYQDLICTFYSVKNLINKAKISE